MTNESEPEVQIESIESIDTPEKRANFRVAIFGTGSMSTEYDKTAIDNAQALASKLIESGFSFSTGGYGGVMEAATAAGAEKAKSLGIDPNTRIKSYPLSETINIPTVRDADTVHSQNLPERLTHLIGESDAFVVLGGGYGTLVELLTTIESERIDRLVNPQDSPRPLIILDPSLKHSGILTQLAKSERKLKTAPILDHIYLLNYTLEATDIAEEIIDIYYRQSPGEDIPEDQKQQINPYNLRQFIHHQETFEGGEGI